MEMVIHDPTVDSEALIGDSESEHFDFTVVGRRRLHMGGRSVRGVGGTSAMGERGR
jgi:hypothetical protein